MTLQKRIMVTGAGGFIGSSACDYFKKNMNVIAVIRNITNVKGPNPLKGTKVIECDLRNSREIELVVAREKPHYVLHLAGQNHVQKSWSEPGTTFEANVLGTINLLEAIRKFSSKSRVIVVGSAIENNNKESSNPYSFSKKIQGYIANSWSQFFDLDLLIAAPTNLIGPGPSQGVCSVFGKKIVDMEKGLCKNVLEVNDLYTQRDFLDVRDAIKAFEIIFQKGIKNCVYVIASGKSRTLEEIVRAFQELSHVNFKYNIQTYREEKPIVMNIQLLQELGWVSKYSLSTSLQDILIYYRDNFYKSSNES